MVRGLEKVRLLLMPASGGSKARRGGRGPCFTLDFALLSGQNSKAGQSREANMMQIVFCKALRVPYP